MEFGVSGLFCCYILYVRHHHHGQYYCYYCSISNSNTGGGDLTVKVYLCICNDVYCAHMYI